VYEKPCRSRDACRCDDRNDFAKKAVDNAEGFGIGKDKEDESGIETIFDFEKEPV